MISFLRKNAAYIGWTIVIFFGATLFSSSFFLGGNTNQASSTASVEEVRKAPILIDGKPLHNYRFETYYNQLLSQVDYNKTGGKVAPEIMELVLYNAGINTIRDMVIITKAQEDKTEIKKGEVKQALNSAIIQYGLKNKKELKQKLKLAGMTLDQFKANIKENLLIQKYTKQIQDNVIVTDQDVDNQYVKAKVRHILIKADYLSKSDVEVLVQQLYDELQSNRISFEDAVSKYSEDAQTKTNKGDLGWIYYGQTLPEFEEVVFELPINTVSRPVKTLYGYHFIEVLERQQLDKPDKIDYEQERNKLLAQKQQRVMTLLVQPAMSAERLVFQWPLLKAHHAKRNGDVTTAEAAYQLLSSQQSFSVVPHYLLANLYLNANELKKATREIEKGSVKIEVDQTQSFPEFYLLAAEIYQKNKDIKLRNKAYDDAFKLAENNHLLALNELKKRFNINQDTKRLKKVKKAIKVIEKKNKEAAEQRKKELEEQLAKEAGIGTKNETVVK